ncbi:helix-turn-helix domain-containing protein [Actinacidiphila acididurans]|uniref:Pyridoxamine 5'-phosphate oxidase family protein n=1 Tax=Actinacidiphila acididurans TaxID=2784346 RepID=A0ABS2TN61_9ACTN|nr:pyridoxamine 5'-phosphate oxidase family protein [Actinacidiphila acididurans]MBM9504436.1 pyridoxamine 5'-phosphate oxidase family protein [Actinacidiphila acididurans]
MPKTAGPRGDIGRRLTHRREELGLSREQVAERAGVATAYLQYVEERPSANPGPSFMLRVAEALQTTVPHLRGGDADLPPGTGAAPTHPVFTELPPQESMALLSGHGVGRIALTTDAGPAILPVNYDVIDGDIVLRTAPADPVSLAAGHEVAFEVDRIDEALSSGWSVLVVGPADEVTDAGEVRGLRGRAYTTPWVGGDREMWLRIRPVRVTGRRITAG